MKIWNYLHAAGVAANRQASDPRCHCLGAVAIRNDGAVVRSRNGFGRNRIPSVHAESRILRKLDVGSIVFVARVRRTGFYGLARPCSSCLLGLFMKGVKEVYYTTDTQGEYGCIDLETIRSSSELRTV